MRSSVTHRSFSYCHINNLHYIFCESSSNIPTLIIFVIKSLSCVVIERTGQTVYSEPVYSSIYSRLLCCKQDHSTLHVSLRPGLVPAAFAVWWQLYGVARRSTRTDELHFMMSPLGQTPPIACKCALMYKTITNSGMSWSTLTGDKFPSAAPNKPFRECI